MDQNKYEYNEKKNTTENFSSNQHIGFTKASMLQVSTYLKHLIQIYSFI